MLMCGLLMRMDKSKHLHVRSHRGEVRRRAKKKIVGALMDITDSRKSQAALEAAQQRWPQLASRWRRSEK